MVSDFMQDVRSNVNRVDESVLFESATVLLARLETVTGILKVSRSTVNRIGIHTPKSGVVCRGASLTSVIQFLYGLD